MVVYYGRKDHKYVDVNIYAVFSYLRLKKKMVVSIVGQWIEDSLTRNVTQRPLKYKMGYNWEHIITAKLATDSVF